MLPQERYSRSNMKRMLAVDQIIIRIFLYIIYVESFATNYM